MAEEKENGKEYNYLYRTDLAIRDKLNALVAISKLKQKDIIDYLINIALEFDLMLPEWKEKLLNTELKNQKELLEKKFSNDLKKISIQHDLNQSSKMDDRKFTVSMKQYDAYLKSMSDDERKEHLNREFQHNRLTSSLSDSNLKSLPESVKNGFQISINGKQVTVKKLDPEGMPILEFNQDRLIRCEGGFHTKASWCHPCSLISSCVIVRKERMNL